MKIVAISKNIKLLVIRRNVGSTVEKGPREVPPSCPDANAARAGLRHAGGEAQEAALSEGHTGPLRWDQAQ